MIPTTQEGVEELLTPYWKREFIEKGRYRITKTGAFCPLCSKHSPFPLFKSTRIQMAEWKNEKGVVIKEFEWLSTKCGCFTLITYKSGKPKLIRGPYFDKINLLEALECSTLGSG